MSGSPPKQERSQKRVERLLDVAAELVSEHGVNGFAFRSVAERAGTAQGSLYRFFPTREAALVALHERYALEIVALASQFAAFLDAMAKRDASRHERHTWIAERAVETFGPFYRDNPAYSALRRWANAAEARSIEDAADEAIVDLIAPSLCRFDREVTTERAREITCVLIDVADTLLMRTAVEPRWASEAVHALAGYLDRATAPHPEG